MTSVVSEWIVMVAGEEYAWGGGVGTFSSETAATFSSRAPGQTNFFDHADISLVDSDGGVKNFLLPRGTIIKSSAAARVAPAGIDNDLRPLTSG